MSEPPYRILVVNKKDNVATALCAIPKNAQVSGIQIRQEIAYGHKIAIADIPAGGEVIKYGQVIGIATYPIARGEHVHVHNVSGRRGRGDQQTQNSNGAPPCYKE